MTKHFYICLTRAITLSLMIGAFLSVAAGQANVQGQWSTMSATMPINPVHVALLSSGKVLVVAGSGNCPPSQSGCPSGPPYGTSNGSGALLLDPVSGQILSRFSLSWDMFCNGMVLLQDGRALIDGGTIQYDPFYGQPQASIFDPAANTFTNTPNMAHGRWYPTVLTLGDGRVMAFSGLDETNATNDAVEFYTIGSGWSTQYFASWTPDLYPRLHLLPDGTVFYSGAQTTSKLFTPATQSWNTNVANTIYSGTRTYGTSILLPLTPANNYDPKIVIMGGGSPATKTTEIIDMGAASPKWVSGLNMTQARIEMNAVILPNGKILALGGSVNDEDTGTLSLNADLFDLSTVNLTTTPAKIGTLSSAGTNATERLYHSVALLLPNGTVWLAGGNPSRGTYNNTMEIYQPAYLFNSDGTMATRPSITTAPGFISYGNNFSVTTPNATSIASVVLVRNGTVTHAFGMDQREVALSFTSGSGALTVTAPPNGNIAPPGYYMLFLLNTAGVPSIATFVQIGNPVPAAPANLAATPGSAQVGLSWSPSSGANSYNVKRSTTSGGPYTTIASPTTASYTDNGVTNGTTYYYVVSAVNSAGESANSSQVSAKPMAGTSSAPVLAQVNSGPSTIQASNKSVAVVYPGAQTAGDLNIVVAGWGDTTSTISSVTDTRGNVYTRAVGPTTNTGLQQSIYYAKNIAAGSNTVTVAFNQAASYPDVRILEYSGLSATNPLDATAAASGSGTAANSGAAATTSANELIFGAGTTGAVFTAAGSGFTNRIINIYGSIAEDKTVTVTGSYNATATAASSVWVMQAATFRGSGQVANPAPTVSAVSPASGTTAGGTAVIITGTGFLAGASVTFGGAAATSVVIVSGTSITAHTPAHAAGAVNIVVTNTDSQSGTFTGGYSYTSSNPAPTITSISPASGTTAGGTAVTITGTGFLAGASVTFGGTAATSVVIVSGTSITAHTPAHAAGAVNIVVTNTDSQSGTLTNGFSYTGSVFTVTSVQVNSGPSTIQASNKSVAVAYPGAQTAGDLNIVVAGWGDTTSTISSVTDTRGNVYTRAVGPTTNTGLQQSIYYAKNIAAGSNTVTVTFNQAASYPDVRILEYSGLSATNPLDATAAASGSGTAANSGAAATTSANELIFGAGTTGAVFTAAGSGFTNRIINIYGSIAEDKTVTAAGSYNATATTASSVWVMQAATFRGGP